jgi:hypothetical protein
VIKKRCIAFVLSDFKAAPYGDTLSLAAKRHDIIGVMVHDPAEQRLPKAGLVNVRVAESDTVYLLDTSAAETQAAVSKHFELLLNRFQEQFKKAKADTLILPTNQSYIHAFHRFFKSRASG